VNILLVAENLYTKRFGRSLTHIPNHVAIIQDGNRWYAKAHGKDTEYGHRLGADTTHAPSPEFPTVQDNFRCTRAFLNMVPHPISNVSRRTENSMG
jgi:hypothetical protein